MTRSWKTAPLVVPILSAGRHRSARQGACFMEFASYLAGERWSDHPACTHPLLAALARDVNDLTSDAERDRLMPLVHRVIGLRGDDHALAAVIAVRAAAAALPIASMERQRALAVGILGQLTVVDDEQLRQLASEAFAQAPDAERWARGYLSRAHFAGRHADRAAAAMVHTAVVGMALACADDVDARLRALLSDTIDDLERRTHGTPATTQAPALVLA